MQNKLYGVKVWIDFGVDGDVTAMCCKLLYWMDGQ